MTDTLIDVFIGEDGKLYKKVLHADGTKERVLVDKSAEADPSMSERFADTETVPNDWSDPGTEAITAPPNPMTREERSDMSLRIEALMAKWTTRTTGNSGTIDTKGNTAVKEMLIDLCRALGGPWLDVAERII